MKTSPTVISNIFKNKFTSQIVFFFCMHSSVARNLFMNYVCFNVCMPVEYFKPYEISPNPDQTE